jgi:hypothetical protein
MTTTPSAKSHAYAANNAKPSILGAPTGEKLSLTRTSREIDDMRMMIRKDRVVRNGEKRQNSQWNPDDERGR